MFELERKKQESGRLPTTTTAPMTTSMTATTTAATTTTASPSAPQQSYRVLEAESPQTGGGTVGAGDTAATTGTTAGGYHVLEASPVVPGSAQRTSASDVLEKARNRFDKFWGKGNNDTEN